MAGLIRQGHFLGAKLRALRKRHGLTLDELSARCVHFDAASAPSVSYLSMVETGKRMPSYGTLETLAGVFSKNVRWFLDENPEVEVTPQKRERGGLAAMPLEPAFLFSHDLLRNALPELLSQTGTTGRQFAQLLIRVWQETRHNDFPDIERAAEQAGKRELPLSLEALMAICKQHGLQVRWFDGNSQKSASPALRSRFEAPGTVFINARLRDQEDRLKYDLAFAIGHKILHNGDGLLPAHRATQSDGAEPTTGVAAMGTQDVLHAWRDFECSFFAGALLCPRIPFRRFLVRESHNVAACRKLGLTAAVVMRRMTSVSPYRHWHFFDAYPPGLLRAVYRGNGIPLPWGNMSLVSDPCPRWAVFQMLHHPPTGKGALIPRSQISVMHDSKRPRLYCCHSLVTRDAADVMHVLSVGIDLVPALDAQGYDGEAVVAEVADACRRGGDGVVPAAAAGAMRAISQVLRIGWVADALRTPASVICPRSNTCPRQPKPCASVANH
jgi:transcriptional regulator with XRE-family HTH domain/Zn-dependent peptidase ImmA (M78 family)